MRGRGGICEGPRGPGGQGGIWEGPMGIRVFCGGVKGVGVVGKDLALRESPPGLETNKKTA